MELVIYIYAFLLLILLLFAANAFFLALNTFREPSAIEPDLYSDCLPMVTVQLPVFNEENVVERLLLCVSEMDYPKALLEIQLIDDSTDDTPMIAGKVLEEMNRKGFAVEHIRRSTRDGFKAGALSEATATARGEFMAIFDADFLPPKDFIRRLLPMFDRDTAFVQARWEHLNRDENLLTRAEAIFLDGHFAVEQFARYESGCFINFNGTAGLWRKSDIEAAGGWQSDTLAEDLDLSYRAQICGKRGVFTCRVSAPAELPSRMNAARAQQYRWTKGAAETSLKILPSLLTSPSLSIGKRIQGLFHLSANLIYPVILALVLVAPIYNSIKFQIDSAANQIMPFFGLGLAFTWFFYFRSQQLLRRGLFRFLRDFPIALAISMGFALSNTRAIISALLGHKSEFVRTPKAGENARKYRLAKDRATIVLEFALCVYSLASAVLSVFAQDAAGAVFSMLFAVGFGIVAIGTAADK